MNSSIALGRQVFVMAAAIALPILLVGLVVGLMAALFQALTSLQEQTLTMVPKIVAVGAALFMLLPYILGRLADFTVAIFEQVGQVGLN